MSHALATVLHRGRKAASNIIAACLASSRGGTPQCSSGGWAGDKSEIRNVRIRLIQVGRTTERFCYQVVAGPKGPAYKGYQDTCRLGPATRMFRNQERQNLSQPETHDPKSEIRNPKFVFRNPKSEIRNPKFVPRARDATVYVNVHIRDFHQPPGRRDARGNPFLLHPHLGLQPALPVVRHALRLVAAGG